MYEKSILSDFELLVVIVNQGLGSKVSKIAKQHQIQGGTIIPGLGTYHHPILEFLELSDIRKEIIFMIAPRMLIYPAMVALNQAMHFEKRNHGIAFVLPNFNFLGAGKYDECCEDITQGGMNMTTYQAIFTIVNKGKGHLVVASAAEVGAKGATIINARGSGIHETAKLFNIEIEPEKEIILILAKKEVVPTILAKVRDDLKIDQPGNGIMFVQEVHQTFGIRE